MVDEKWLMNIVQETVLLLAGQTVGRQLTDSRNDF